MARGQRADDGLPNAGTQDDVPGDRARQRAALADLRGGAGLEAEHAFVSAILETIDALVVVLDREGRIVRFNRACERVTGYAFEEVRSKPFWDIFLLPDETESVRGVFRELRDGQFPNAHENYWLTRDGSRVLIAWSNTALLDADGKPEYIISTGIDITARRRAEEERAQLLAREQVAQAQAAAEAKFRLLVDSAPDALLVVDRSGEILLANAQAERLFGYQREELLGRRMDILVPERLRGVQAHHLAGYMAAPSARRMGGGRELTGRRKDGSEFPVEATISALQTVDGPLVAASFRDVTERQRAEEALRESERRFRAIFDQTFEFIGLLSPDGTLLEANRTSLDFVGATLEQVVGRPFWETPWWSHSPAVQERLKAAIDEAAQGKLARFEGEHPRADGLVAKVDFSLKPVLDENGRVVLLIPEGRDITERKRLEEERAGLLRSERAARAQAEGAAQRLRALQTVTDTALAHLDLERLLSELLGRLRDLLAVDAITILLLSEDGQQLAVRATLGLEEAMAMALTIPLSRGVAGRIASTGQPLVVDDLTAVELAHPLMRDKGVRSLLGVPLLVEGRVMGVVHVGTLRPRHFTEDETRLLQLAADRIALAIDHARLFEAAQRARAEAEAAAEELRKSEGRLRFLAEASQVLGSSLEYETILENVARLAVPVLADWCAVEMVAEGESIQHLAVAHVDPSREALARELRQRYPGIGHGGVYASALQTGQTRLVAEVTDEWLATVARDAEHLELLRQLGLKSYMVVPLVARGRASGVMIFALTEADRRYGPDDLALAEELARRAALAADNGRLYREVQEALQMRDQLLALATHDLKNPLQGIKGWTQLLQRQIGRANLPETARLTDGLAKIEATSARMSGLINELLDVARLQMGQQLAMEPNPTDLVRLAQRTVATQQVTGGHVLRIEAAVRELVGQWDAARLERVLDNLLGNALKFSPRGGEIRVQVAQEDDRAVLRVQDQGVGIPSADLPRIFERFRRGRNVVGRISGTGIGLWGARQIVEQHGGTITVESQEGAGTTVSVRLPLPS